MKAVALTGSLGSGKSTVLKTVRKMHISTVDCDRIVALLYRDKKVKKKLIAIFGSSSKRAIADIAFSSPSKRKRLEALLHPLVWKQVRQKLASFRKRNRKLAVVDVPLLFEIRWQKRFDSTVFVKASKKLCTKRLLKKGYSRKQIALRWKAQLSPGKKVKSSDFLIDNNGSFARTGKQVRALLLDLR